MFFCGFFFRVNNFLIECSCLKIFVVKYMYYVEKEWFYFKFFLENYFEV